MMLEILLGRLSSTCIMDTFKFGLLLSIYALLSLADCNKQAEL
jgi:hypothetical protein